MKFAINIISFPLSQKLQGQIVQFLYHPRGRKTELGMLTLIPENENTFCYWSLKLLSAKQTLVQKIVGETKTNKKTYY